MVSTSGAPPNATTAGRPVPTAPTTVPGMGSVSSMNMSGSPALGPRRPVAGLPPAPVAIPRPGTAPTLAVSTSAPTSTSYTPQVPPGGYRLPPPPADAPPLKPRIRTPNAELQQSGSAPNLVADKRQPQQQQYQQATQQHHQQQHHQPPLRDAATMPSTVPVPRKYPNGANLMGQMSASIADMGIQAPSSLISSSPASSQGQLSSSPSGQRPVVPPPNRPVIVPRPFNTISPVGGMGRYIVHALTLHSCT